MPRAVLSAEAVRRLAIKKIRVEASGRLGFQLIKYPGGHVNEVPERTEGVAMFEYIGFQKAIAQKLWLTYKSQNQAHGHDLFVHAEKYLTRKFEQHKNRPLQELLAGAGLNSTLISSLTRYLQWININEQFRQNKVLVHNLRDWAIMKAQKNYDTAKFLDAQILNPSGSLKASFGMFPLSLKGNFARGQIVGNTGRPVADGFYVEKDGRLVPGWRSRGLPRNTIITPEQFWLVP